MIALALLCVTLRSGEPNPASAQSAPGHATIAQGSHLEVHQDRVAYLAQNRARGVLALWQRDHYLYLSHVQEYYGAVIFQVGQWKRFYVLIGDPEGTSHPKLKRLVWHNGRLLEEPALHLISKTDLAKKSNPERLSMFERYLRTCGYRCRISDRAKITDLKTFVEFSYDPFNNCLSANCYCSDGRILKDRLIEVGFDKFENETTLDLPEHLRAIRHALFF